MQIQLPDNVITSAQHLALQTGFPGVEEYLSYLVISAQEDHDNQSQLEQKLLHGLTSPVSSMTGDDWSELRARIFKANIH